MVMCILAKLRSGDDHAINATVPIQHSGINSVIVQSIFLAKKVNFLRKFLKELTIFVVYYLKKSGKVAYQNNLGQ